MTDAQVKQIQLIEQNIQQLALQKQSMQSQLIEYESALTELKNTPETWKIIGSIMVKTSAESVSNDLAEKKRILDLRVETLEAQEDKLRSKAQDLQKSIVENMKDGKNE